MKAVQVDGPGNATVVDVPLPEPVEGELLVRVEIAAMCATDVKLTAKGANPPRVPGHEIAGRLEDGTLVGVHPDIGCGKCRFCGSGMENRCPHRVSIGLGRDGGFAERVLVPSGHAIPLDAIDGRIGALLEPLACCIHAVAMLGVEDGDFALVVGAGPMGILSMWVLKHHGARVAVAQRSAARRSVARRLGADHVVAADTDIESELGERPIAALVTAPGAAALAFALQQVTAGGVVHAFAGTPGGASIDANVIHYRHLRLLGSTGSTTDDYRTAAHLARRGSVPLADLPTTTVPLEQLPHFLMGTAGTDALKVLVSPEGGSLDR
jgi:L-iditol 2-dehydrogenase